MAATSPNADYAGDITCTEAWELLKADTGAQVVDVRTVAEWSYVGLPDLTALGRRVLTVEWHGFGTRTVNPDFVPQVHEALDAVGAGPETAVVFLCRSGVRSRLAATAMTQAGFKRAYNVADGFEGDLDNEYHRGRRNGWKAAGLPWRQS
ncbi:MAG: rhodanese-like domain-containing protein [Alphaproteobacteria bacterium]|nr:rhodanese-like domain-containing protein [Alphaproteobacteria bacterium]MBU6474042.1 rhodanese-like domain-containing protein [Alphaproteobacteria bacterium]MDE2011568.1 rhodanese-like domain-containing protein [Alphaproteobacteria bacterium]MDE2071914.1 rhodanese-like domain-containing protein [Alphaproteobacteria bacterium]MDE2352003.1 rhodanese-like domain-containing protein [Alphaproteobacteria bacterium]